jgi:hypothetical protein
MVALLVAAMPGGAAEGPFERIGVPGEPGGWTVTGDGLEDGHFELSEGALGEGLRITFDTSWRDGGAFDREKYGYNHKRRVTMRLKEPVPLHREARRMGMWLYAGGWLDHDRSWLRFIFQDADGLRYTYDQQCHSGHGRTWNWVECRNFESQEAWRLDESIILVEGGLQHRMPKRPIKLLGFEIDISTIHWPRRRDLVLEFGPAYADGIHREDSEFYWNLHERYVFGEMPFGRRPFVTPADLKLSTGDWRIAWTARMAQHGRPVEQGVWELEGYTGSVEDRFQRLELPLKARGQYWLDFRARRTDAGGGAARSIQLRIVRGPEVDPAPVPVEFGADAEFVDFVVPVELPRRMPLKRLAARLVEGKKTLSSLRRMVGQETRPAASSWTRRDEVMRFDEIFRDGNHLLSCAEWGGKWGRRIREGWFEAWVRDVKKQNGNTIELFPDWQPLEPMPGVFYWAELDRRIEIISKHGLKVMINLNPTAHPDWLVVENQANDEGMTNGIWHGGGNDFKSPSSRHLWRHFSEFCRQMALHCRNKPAVIGYSCHSLFFDHFWADHPWRGQYVDYSQAAHEGFRDYLRDELGFSIDEVSERYGREFASWEELDPPRPRFLDGSGRIDRPDARPQWRDWINYRKWVQRSFFTEMIIGTIRRYDDLRPVGTHGQQAPAQW